MTNLDSIATQVTLSVSCVYYDTEIDIFEKTLNSITDALTYAKSCNTLDDYELHLINNNPKQDYLFQECIKKHKLKSANIIIHNGHGNLGYGRANNIAIARTECKYHLILNPDIITEIQAIKLGVEYLEQNATTGLIAPNVNNSNGEVEYLAKRMPTFLVIFLRGLNNKYLNRMFDQKLADYAYKDKIPCDKPFGIELASGCFMLCRSSILKKIGGFSDKYFLYFEDFDLSKKISAFSKLIYLPQMKVCHLGGYAAKKGLIHKKLFFTSYIIFIKSFRKTSRQ